MKKLFLLLLLGTVAVLTMIVYERFIVQGMFGPTSQLAAVLLTGTALFLIASYCFYDTQHRERVRMTWLALMSIVVSYLAIDLIAGAVLIQSLSPQLVPDEVRHHKLVANAYSKFEQQDFSYVQRVNNFGLRGPDITSEKSPDQYRILTMGDSFTMGKGVEDHQTFSARLEAALNENRPQSCPRTIQVLNGGVDSYAPVLEYLYLRHELMSLNPDMVILNLDVSDLVQEAAYRAQAVFDNQGNVLRVPGSETRRLLNERIRTWIDQNLYITRLLLFYTNKLLGYRDLSVRGVVTQANMETAKHTLVTDDQDRTEQWQMIFSSLSQIKQLCDEQGIEFLLTIYPWGHQVSPDEWVPGRDYFIPEGAQPSEASERTVVSLSAEHGIKLLNQFDLFQTYTGSEPLYFDNDPHWTVAGQRLMADGLTHYLLDQYSANWCR
ncbi:MAG: hypothetical protein R3E82_05385 [Pseudomonadales bacterium]